MITLMSPDVTVIIPAHNAEGTIADQLEALSRQTGGVTFDTVVVTNRCTDRTESVARSFAGRMGLTLVKADMRASAGYARNAGARVAKGHHLLFCDADDAVERCWVASMSGALERADFVQGRLVLDRAKLPSWAERYYSAIDDLDLQRFGAVRYPSGCSFGCRREVFAQVGGFSEEFFGAAGEDTELALRLFRAGFRVGIADDAVLRYRPRSSLMGVVRQKSGYSRGVGQLLASEGMLKPPRPLWRQYVSLGRAIGRAVLEQRRSPKDVAALGMIKHSHMRAMAAARVRYGGTATTPDRAADFTVPLSTPVLGGLAFLATPRMAPWYGTSGIEQTSIGVVEALLSDGGTFVDVGANIGTFSIAAAKVIGARGHVVAFEPDPRTRSLLERNAIRHAVGDRISIRSEAVGSRRGSAGFRLHEADVVSGFGLSPESFNPGDIVQERVVDVIRLDDVGLDVPTLVKVDVEGFEMDVLAGMEGLLAGSRPPCLLIEFNPAAQRANGHDPRDLLDSVGHPRWQTWLVEEPRGERAGRITRLDDAGADRLVRRRDSWYSNLLVVPAERAGDESVSVATRCIAS